MFTQASITSRPRKGFLKTMRFAPEPSTADGASQTLPAVRPGDRQRPISPGEQV